MPDPVKITVLPYMGPCKQELKAKTYPPYPENDFDARAFLEREQDDLEPLDYEFGAKE